MWIIFVISLILLPLIHLTLSVVIAQKWTQVNLSKLLNVVFPFDNLKDKAIFVGIIIGIYLVIPISVYMPAKLTTEVLEDDDGELKKMDVITFFKFISLTLFVILGFYIFLFLSSNARVN